MNGALIREREQVACHGRRPPPVGRATSGRVFCSFCEFLPKIARYTRPGAVPAAGPRWYAVCTDRQGPHEETTCDSSQQEHSPTLTSSTSKEKASATSSTSCS